MEGKLCIWVREQVGHHWCLLGSSKIPWSRGTKDWLFVLDKKYFWRVTCWYHCSNYECHVGDDWFISLKVIGWVLFLSYAFLMWNADGTARGTIMCDLVDIWPLPFLVLWKCLKTKYLELVFWAHCPRELRACFLVHSRNTMFSCVFEF